MAKLRLYTIKHKGATWKANMVFEEAMVFKDQTKIYVGYWFFTKKEAKKYLETFKYPEFFEVVGMTVGQVKADNRYKTKK